MEEKYPIYLLGEFRLDVGPRKLEREGVSIHLTNLPFRVLVYLIERRDRLVTREELLDRFWEGRDVYDDSLRKAVGAIRKALDDWQALASNPNFFIGHAWYANTLLAQGKFAAAEAECLRAQELDPLNTGFLNNLAETYYYWRQPDRCLTQAAKALELEPGNEWASLNNQSWRISNRLPKDCPHCGDKIESPPSVESQSLPHDRATDTVLPQ